MEQSKPYRKTVVYPFLGADDHERSSTAAPLSVKNNIRNSFFEVLEVVRRGKWWILAVFILVVAAMAAFTIRQAPAYSAYTLLLLDPQGGGKDTDAMRYGTLGETGFDIRSQILILQQSLQIVERTADRLQRMKTLPNSTTPIEILNDSEGQPRSLSELATAIQKKHVFVGTEGDWHAGALRVTALSPSAEEAALLANLYSEEYVRFAQETSRYRIAASRAFLERQINQRREELQKLESQITEHVNRDGLVALDDGPRAAVDQVMALEEILDETRMELRIKEAYLQSLESELDRMKPSLARQLEPSAAEEIERLRAEILRIEGIVDPIYARNPELRLNPGTNDELVDLQRRLDLLRERMQELSGQYADEISSVGGGTKEQTQDQLATINRDIIDHRIHIDALKARITTLEERLRDQREKLGAVPAYAIQLAQLERARESVAELYTSLAAKLQETRVAEESEVGFVSVVRRAIAPEKPDRPNRAKNMFIGVVLGLMLGFLAAVVRHWLDSRVYTPADVTDRGLRVLGTVSDMRPVIRKEVGKNGKIKVGESEVHATLMPLIQPYSPIAEAYRHVYVTLQFMMSEKVVQTILISSAQTGEGKSTTALNLAITTAAANRRTLIIDADLRRPTLASYLGQDTPVSLPEFLQMEDFDDELLATGIDNLFALTTVNPVARSAEILGSPRMRNRLRELKSRFDVIILDTPPLLALTDAALLAPHCDAAIVVASAGRTISESLDMVVAHLDEAGVYVAGVVLNRFSPTATHKQTYGYRYGRQSAAYYSIPA